MVPIPESVYFPSLDKCLNGDLLLLSWRSIFSAIQSSSATDRQPTIEQFLSDPTVLALLAKPFDAFPPPNPQTKAAYETKTSAINVTPSSSARHDIKQVKDDSVWLSKVAKINELSALRVVVQECQSRTSAKLLGPFSEDELAGIRESAGNSKFTSPMTVSLLSRGIDQGEAQAEFGNEGNRRQRILVTYLSERRHLLKCAECLLHAGLIPASRESYSRKGKESEAAATWVENCGEALVGEIGGDQLENFALRCFAAIEANVQNIGNGSGWFEEECGKPEIEIEWIRTQILEATHAVELLLQILVPYTTIPSSQLVLRWLRLLQSCGFFDQFNIEEPSLQILVRPLQCISMVISLTIFNVQRTLDHIMDPRSEAVVSADVPAENSFILNTQTIREVHEIAINAADMGFITAGPVILAWVSILKALDERVKESKTLLIEENEASVRLDRRSFVEPTDPYEAVVEEIMSAFDDNVIDYLARSAVNNAHVLDTISILSLQLGSSSDAFFSDTTGAMMRCAILSLVKCSQSGMGYMPEVIEALLSTLSGGQNYWDFVDSKHQSTFDPIAEFLEDGDLVDAFLWTARGRYPYEPLPFLRLIHAIASHPSHTDEDLKPAISVLNTIPQFTYRLPEDFVEYETAQEEDNLNKVLLRTPVHLFGPRSKSLGSQVQPRSLALTLVDKDFCIASGTEGRVISDSGPRVVTWHHEYSGLKYFGKLLETFLTASDLVDATTGLPADRDSVVEIIDILATLLLSTSKSGVNPASGKEDARNILETASSGLSRNRDITTVIFEIFEEELQRQSAVSGSEVPLGVLVSCLHFIHAMILVSPSRVWPLLARSSFLGVSRGSGRLSSIVESVELVSGRYEFLISCVRLYEALVADIVRNAIKRRSGVRSSGRFSAKEDAGAGVPDQLLSKVLQYFTRYLIDVLESSFSWKFVTQNDRRRLCKTIAITFDKILRYVYGIETKPKADESSEPTNTLIELPSKLAKSDSKVSAELASKITGILISSASQIVDSFLSPSSTSLKFQPLLVTYLDALDTPDSTTYLNELVLWTTQVNAVLAFSKTLMQVSNSLERPSSQLELQIFQAAPLIARLYAVTDVYKKDIVVLFEALIITANNASEPPSLLGHLGPRTAKNFLHILSDLDKPVSEEENVIAIWHFLSMVVSNKQQWFANYLLTGKTPRDAVGKVPSTTDSSALDKPLLTVALDSLSKINEIPKNQTLVMLEFVALAQNFWPWTVYGSPKHSDFIKSISEYAGTLRPIQPSSNIQGSMDACFQTRIAAYIAEILAMHLFHSRQTRNPSSVNDLIANLSWFIRFAVMPPSLNPSLHAQLKRNFETRFPRCTAQDLKRTTLEDRQLGKNYFYDIPLADKMLFSDQAWTGRKNDGLRAEFEHANVNLSLVDSQIALFHSWKVLAIEISSNISADVDLQRALIKVSIDCLIANSKSDFSEEIFFRLCHQRADLALILTQRLIEAKCTLPELKGLLTRTWETIRNFRGNFEKALLKEDTPYYRSLLKLLFIAIRAHACGDTRNANGNFNASVRMTRSAEIVPVILDIIKFVVAMGFRDSVSIIHDNPAESLPEDIALITGILQSCLQVPGIDLSQSQIVSTIVANDTARVATTLFSWSDSIAMEGDPIYGELSILFLLELSSIPLMAEQLAIDGVLGHIASANITSYLRRGNVSPFAEGAGLQRCYSIWARGILPFLLNLLDSVQGSIAAEVATFLNQFSPLLDQSAKAFEAPESSRTASKVQMKYISLSMCSEVHSLALLSFILNGFRDSLRGITEIPEVKWDAAGILENVDFWLGAKSVLRERIIPMGARDVELAKQKVDKGSSNGLGGAAFSRLEECVVSEMMGIRDVLSGGEA